MYPIEKTDIDRIDKIHASVNGVTVCACIGVEQVYDEPRSGRLYLGKKHIADITNVSTSMIYGKTINGFAIHGRTYRDITVAAYFYEAGYAEGLLKHDQISDLRK